MFIYMIFFALLVEIPCVSLARCEGDPMPTEKTFQIVTIEEAKDPGSSVLKQRAGDVDFPLSAHDQAIIEALKAQTLSLKGVGLAAPQIGEARRIAAIYIPEEATLLRDEVIPYPVHVLINPTYEPIEEEGIWHDFEGCYSVTSKAGKVPRYNAVRVHYQDEQGVRHTSIERGLYGRVIQHEVDHLNGYLIIDRLTPDCVQGTMEEMMALRRQELTPEKRELLERLLQERQEKITQDPESKQSS